MVVRNHPDSLSEITVSSYEKCRVVRTKLGESNQVQDKQRVYPLLLKASISQDRVAEPKPHIWLGGEFMEVPSLALVVRVTEIESGVVDVGSKKPAAVGMDPGCIQPLPETLAVNLDRAVKAEGSPALFSKKPRVDEGHDRGRLQDPLGLVEGHAGRLRPSQQRGGAPSPAGSAECAPRTE